jgi:hypothetical protein
MGLILALILFILFVGFLSYVFTESSSKKIMIDNALSGMVIVGVICCVILTIVISASYSSHVTLKRKLVTIEQYKETINFYAKRGISEFTVKDLIVPGREMTDFKYNKYQEQMGKMIIDLRDSIISYNESLTEKKVLNNSWFFSWVIIVDDNMKTIKMGDYLE